MTRSGPPLPGETSAFGWRNEFGFVIRTISLDIAVAFPLMLLLLLLLLLLLTQRFPTDPVGAAVEEMLL